MHVILIFTKSLCLMGELASPVLMIDALFWITLIYYQIFSKFPTYDIKIFQILVLQNDDK